MKLRLARRAGVLLVGVLLAACTTHSTAAPQSSVVTQTEVVGTTTPPPTYVPPPAQTVTPLPPSASPGAGEVEKPCPYIASTPEENPTTNVADIDGSHVYRTTIITTTKPVGCRFYFYAPSFYAIADIVPTTFATDVDAHNAMVLTADAGTEAQGHPQIVPGVDAVVFRTKFFGEDGAQDWACAFAKGRVMVVVHTERTDTSLNALELAAAIAPKF